MGTTRLLQGRCDAGCPLTYTPDGKCLICCYSGKSVRFWDPATGKELRRIVAPDDDVWAYALSPDGKTLVTGGLHSAVLRLWDASTGKELQQFTGSPKGTSALAFSADGKTLAAGLGDGVVRLWDVGTGQVSRELRPAQQGWLGDAVVFLPDGKTLITAGDAIPWGDLSTGGGGRRVGRRVTHARRLRGSPGGKRPAAPLLSAT